MQNEDPTGTAPSPKFTEEYFNTEICNLRTSWGEKGFFDKKDGDWALDAFGAVYYVYLNTPLSDHTEMVMECTRLEFERRRNYSLIGI